MWRWLAFLGFALALLLAAAWWWLPRLWPNGVVAYSPFIGPAIRAEARRREPDEALFGGPWTSFNDRLDERAIPALLSALRHGGAGERLVAAEGLGAIPLPPAQRETILAALAARAGDPDPRMRVAVVTALGAARSHGPLVLAALRDADPEVRYTAVGALAPLKDPRLLPAFAPLLGDSQYYVRTTAVEAIGVVPDRGAVALLLAVPGNLRAVADAALLGRGDLTPAERRQVLARLVGDLRNDRVPMNAQHARDLLVEHGGADGAALVRAALDDRDYQCRQYAADILRELGVAPTPRLVAVSIEGLADDDYPADRGGTYLTYLTNARGGTAWFLAHPEIGTAELRVALAGGDAQRRFLAAWLLGMRGDQASAAAVCRELLPRLGDDGIAGSALWAIRALYRLGPVARPAATAALAGADAQQAACIRLLLRDWSDPPTSAADAARRGKLPLSELYHDPAWEPVQGSGRDDLPEPFPTGFR